MATYVNMMDDKAHNSTQQKPMVSGCQMTGLKGIPARFQPQQLSGQCAHLDCTPLQSQRNLNLHLSYFPAQCSYHYSRGWALSRLFLLPCFWSWPLCNQEWEIHEARRERIIWSMCDSLRQLLPYKGSGPAFQLATVPPQGRHFITTLYPFSPMIIKCKGQ